MSPSELAEMIREIVVAAGDGAESLRRSGTEALLESWSIEVSLDDQPPSAQVVMRFADGRGLLPAS